MTHTPSGRPQADDISRRADIILGFRDRLDLDEEVKLINQLGNGRSVDDDIGGKYLEFTYPGWLKDDFRELAKQLATAARDPDMDAWMKQRIEKLKME